MNYCTICNNNIEPVKKINWPLAIALALFTGGTWLLFYFLYYFYIKEPQCPICGNTKLAVSKIDGFIGTETPNIISSSKKINIEKNINFSNKDVKRFTKSALNSFLSFGGSFLTIIGTIFTFSFLILTFDPSIDDKTAIIICLLIFGLGPLTTGISMIIKSKKQKKESKYKELEEKVLYLAEQNNGILTVSKIAKNTDLTLKESEEFLSELVKNGYVVVDITEDGQLEYRFR